MNILRNALSAVTAVIVMSMVFGLCIAPTVIGVILGLETWMALGGGFLGILAGLMVAGVIECGALFGGVLIRRWYK